MTGSEQQASAVSIQPTNDLNDFLLALKSIGPITSIHHIVLYGITIDILVVATENFLGPCKTTQRCWGIHQGLYISARDVTGYQGSIRAHFIAAFSRGQPIPV